MIEIKKGVEGLIFDVDGTLVDSMPMHYAAWRDIIERYKIDYTRELFEAYAGKSTIEIVKILNQKFGTSMIPEEIVAEKSRYFLNTVKDLKPIQAAVDIVKKYHGIIPLAAGTGGNRKHVELELEVTGLSKYFPVIVTAEDVKNHKPAPDTFLRCAELINVNPTNCQVFEDAVLGLEAADNAGMIATDIRPFYSNTENVYAKLN